VLGPRIENGNLVHAVLVPQAATRHALPEPSINHERASMFGLRHEPGDSSSRQFRSLLYMRDRQEDGDHPSHSQGRSASSNRLLARPRVQWRENARLDLGAAVVRQRFAQEIAVADHVDENRPSGNTRRCPSRPGLCDQHPESMIVALAGRRGKRAVGREMAS